MKTFKSVCTDLSKAVLQSITEPSYIRIEPEDFLTILAGKSEIKYISLQADKTLINGQLQNALKDLDYNDQEFQIILSINCFDDNITIEEAGEYVETLENYFSKDSSILWGISNDSELKENEHRLNIFLSK
ncbi:hypothetical protein [Marinifilum flexuosum]|uniref:hypothetical protein n=1 Tax=Marinifilum flexuosum TaxID=1117708 RepID=UPI000E7316C0|nr:hypothetical protein [Marinifilum flexuosum]